MAVSVKTCIVHYCCCGGDIMFTFVSVLDWALGAIIYENERRDWACPTRSSGPAALSPPPTIMMSIFLCILWNWHHSFRITNCTDSGDAAAAMSGQTLPGITFKKLN